MVEAISTNEKRRDNNPLPVVVLSPLSVDKPLPDPFQGSGKPVTELSDADELWQLLSEGAPSLVNLISDNQELTFEGLRMFYVSKGVLLGKTRFKKNLNLLAKSGKYNKVAELLSY